MTELLALAVTLVGVLISSVIGILAYVASRQAQRVESQRSIAMLYDNLMDFRAAHPEVMPLSRTWTGACFEKMYRQATEDERACAMYYTYAELCTNFCSAVLSARRLRFLEREVFEGLHKPLVKLLLTEHYPYLASLSQEKYLSSYVRDFLKSERAAGWDWQAMHGALANG